MVYKIYFNNTTDRELGIRAIKRPSIPTPSKKIKEDNLNYRDGTLITDYGTYNDIEITINYNFIDRINFSEKCRKIKNWINVIEDNKLILGDNTSYFYKVKQIKIGNIERIYKAKGIFDITFVCDPYEYTNSGQFEMQLKNNTKLYNYGSKAFANWIIEGNGICNLIVNGKTVNCNLDGKLIINTEYKKTYKNNGVIANSTISGKYSDLILKEYTDNTISFTDGFTVKIIPNFREI